MRTPPTARDWDWRSEGFFEPPTAIMVPRPLTLYRVWGGTATELGSPARPGACLSFQRPASRREAEGLFSVFEWGSSCRYLTPFLALPSATLFVGKAHPGDSYDAGLGKPGSQVFVEMQTMRSHLRKTGQAVTLVDDMKGYAVVPHRDRGRRFSS